MAIKDSTLITNVGTYAGGIYLGEKADTKISNTVFLGNYGYYGGAIYLNNTGGNLDISGKTVFDTNRSIKDGGALFVSNRSYESPADTEKYQKLSIDSSVEFKNNFAEGGLFNTPINAFDFSNLGFRTSSVSGKNITSLDHILNNYDMNHRADNTDPIQVHTLTYNANGGQGDDVIEDVSSAVPYKIKGHDTVKMVREGFRFVSWNTRVDGKGTQYNPEEIVTFEKDITLYAQ